MGSTCKGSFQSGVRPFTFCRFGSGSLRGWRRPLGQHRGPLGNDGCVCLLSSLQRTPGCCRRRTAIPTAPLLLAAGKLLGGNPVARRRREPLPHRRRCRIHLPLVALPSGNQGPGRSRPTKNGPALPCHTDPPVLHVDHRGFDSPAPFCPASRPATLAAIVRAHGLWPVDRILRTQIEQVTASTLNSRRECMTPAHVSGDQVEPKSCPAADS